MAVALTRLKLFDSDQSSELDELREMYRRETLQRKLLYNQVGNVAVILRNIFLWLYSITNCLIDIYTYKTYLHMTLYNLPDNCLQLR